MNPMLVVRTRDTTSAAYYEALGYKLAKDIDLEKNKRMLGRDDSGLG